MQSLIHLYNTALAELGGEQIPLNISPIESDAVGAICQNIFPHVLDTVLEAHEWGFASARVVLALLPEQEPRNHSYQYRYALPADCVRPIRIVVPELGHGEAVYPARVNRSPAYVIEGQYILCNVEQAEFLYIARVTEPRRWPAYFADVLVWKMAAGLATSRNNDKQQKQMCDQMYEFVLAKACAKDRAMRNPHEPLSPWQVARGNRGVMPLRGGGW